MSTQILNRDYCTLPAELLAPAKEQLRVEFDRDDEFIRVALSRAISEIEPLVNFDIFATLSYAEVQPANCVQLDRTPIFRIDQCQDDDCMHTTTVDIRYMEGGNQHNPSRAVLNAVGTTGKLMIRSGYEHANQLPPNLVSAILMQVGSLYENREAVQQGTYHALPDQTQRVLSGLWRPSV